MSQYVPALRPAGALGAAASPYAYRLPPDTFLSRRDPNWYIGATPTPTPEQQLEVKRWSDAVASLKTSETAIMAQAQANSASRDPKVKAAALATIQLVLPQIQQQIADAIGRLQAAQKAAGIPVAAPTPESFARLEAMVKRASDDFEANAAAWIDDMKSVIGRLTPTFVTSMESLVENIRRSVFQGSIPRLMERVRMGEVNKQKDIEHLLKISAEAIKSQYEETAKAFRDMGPISTLLFRVVSGLVQAADAIGRYVMDVVIQTIEELQKQAVKNPLGFAILAGGAAAALALYFVIKKG